MKDVSPSLGGGKSEATLDALFTSVASHQRRALIDYLHGNSTPVVLEEIIHEIAEQAAQSPDAVAISLCHQHIPRLDETEIVDFDLETNTVRKGDRFETAINVLEATK